MNHRTRIRLATLPAAAIVGALALTACGPGSTVTDKPKAAAKASSSKPASKPTKQAVAKVGDTIGLKGTEDGSKLDVTVVKTVDNAKSSDGFTSPENGHRWIGVQFRLVNTGTKAYSDSPINGTQIADAEGQQYQPTFADITAGPSMASSVKLSPGAKALGWVVFEVPKGAKAASVQFTMDSGFAQQTGEWKLG